MSSGYCTFSPLTKEVIPRALGLTASLSSSFIFSIVFSCNFYFISDLSMLSCFVGDRVGELNLLSLSNVMPYGTSIN